METFVVLGWNVTRVSSTTSSTAINVSLVSNKLSSVIFIFTVCVVSMRENRSSTVSFVKSKAEMKNC